MKIELRANGLHVSGYVNVTEKKSHPIAALDGRRFIETIEPRAFERALGRAENIALTKDHNPMIILADTKSGSLELYEDDIGLHADALITDSETIKEARAGKLSGWSVGMRNIQDTLKESVDGLPLRRVKNLDLDHVSLLVNKTPAYAATSVSLRADCGLEIRTNFTAPGLNEITTKNAHYKARIKNLKK